MFALAFACIFLACYQFFDILALDFFHSPAFLHKVVVFVQFLLRPGVGLGIVSAVRYEQVYPAGKLVYLFAGEFYTLMSLFEYGYEFAPGGTGMVGGQHGRGGTGH